ncbi:peptidoglycan-binding protein [Tumidithrix elongata RA019]|uniref:Peptidoglycan-binding protein n=1 Tax=Tumidithrix elongata BACA0141 TaxID=2716417 RepID=A0AAW9Q7K8_9CYAN|nr:peptidoglycan-binding protein [Tumidithrix elongata RA019]
MELAAYLHSELTQTQFEQGIDIAPPLDCAGIDAIARSASSSKVGLCVTFAALAVVANLGSVAGASAKPQNANSDIRYVQTLLANNGFDPGPIDGVKGAATKEAIIKAQKSFGLDPDGVAGSQTLAALESRSTPSNVSSDSESSVINLQKLLSDRGFFTGPITGKYGPLTQAAVIAAQKHYGLTPDGIAGVKTLTALETDSAPTTTNISGSDAIALQKLLSDRGFYTGAIDGIMGNQTKAAVIAAQKAYGLTPDGIAGAQTLAALQAGSPSQATSSDASVTELQKLLASRGFYTGAIDGIMGNQTKAAVIAAQKSYGLTPDGIAGTQTLAALKRGTASSSTVSTKPTSPTPTSTTPTVSNNSKVGVSTTSSESIANLQNLLRDRGFYDGPTSGILGPRTRAAIIAAQKAYGLVTDGIAGSATIAALESHPPSAPKPATQPIPTPTTPKPVIQPIPQSTPQAVVQPTPKPAPVATTQPTTTAPFTRSDSVAELQQLLAQRGFYTGTADGVLSNETKNAIIRAQNFYALTPADGNPSAALVDSLKKDPFVVGGN